jgi:hypothetical protein
MEETSQLANLYRREAQALRARPGPIEAAARKDRLRLIRATEAFDAVMARQGRALTAAKTVTEGLVHAIAQEITNQRNAKATYGPEGVKTQTNAATAVTLNRRA